MNASQKYNNSFFLLVIAILLLLTGCSYPSAERKFTDQKEEEIESKDFKNPAEALNKALETTQNSKEAEKFWYQGWVANEIKKRRTTSMYDGVVIRPHGYLVNGKIAERPYRYYKWDDHNFIKFEDSKWFKLKKEDLPFDPLKGFDWWLPFINRAEQLPNEEILSKDCNVMQIEISGDEWITESDNPIFNDLKLVVEETKGMDAVLKNTTVITKIWIGSSDNLIYQYETIIDMPIPSSGYMTQEIFFRFFKYNDPGIKIKSPDEMMEYATRTD